MLLSQGSCLRLSQNVWINAVYQGECNLPKMQLWPQLSQIQTRITTTTTKQQQSPEATSYQQSKPLLQEKKASSLAEPSTVCGQRGFTGAPGCSRLLSRSPGPRAAAALSFTSHLFTLFGVMS